MFTGIVESIGKVKEVIASGSNKSFWIESPISTQLKVDQSVSHGGVCLTVEEVRENRHRVTAIDETFKKTNLGGWQTGTLVNLERCLQVNGRLDGHLVQGHVDATATCTRVKEKDGSREYEFEFPGKFSSLIVEKGSVCIDGISLTAFGVKKKRFRVAIIPYTFEHTNAQEWKEGSEVNIEFDMMGKYIIKYLQHLKP